MKRRILCILCAAVMLLSGCDQGSTPTASSQEEQLTLLATTYPVYLLARAVVGDVDGVEIQRLNTGNVSCLHDYTLSVGDMKLIEGADLIAINGVGLEDFMSDALSAASAQLVDCSQGVTLLENLSHHHEEEDAHDRHGHYDPHIWLDPANAAIMADNLAAALSKADPAHAEAYSQNLLRTKELIAQCEADLKQAISDSAVEVSGLITFHDGFQYFAHAFDLPLLAAIEEEAGSEASAKEINEITTLVQEKRIPMIFTEKNGSDATAQTIARETGCSVGQLNMLMSGEEGALEAYLDVLAANVSAIVNGFAGREVMTTG